MPSDAVRPRLIHVRDNILLAQGFVGDRTFAQFSADTLVVYGVVRCLEIISEASRHLDDATRARHDLPWNNIAGAGNVYRHGYDGVRLEAVWNTLKSDLPPLLAAVEAELARPA